MPQDRTLPADAPPDPVALARVLRRLARAGEPPWLHQEVARRMAERLKLIRNPPRDWIDWWGGLGGGAQAVADAWPQAVRSVVEPTSEWAAASRRRGRRRWWTFGQGETPKIRLEDEVGEGSAGMLWANMVLHASADPAATAAKWHRALGVDGLLMFSTLGPQTLAELRSVYAAQGWPAPHPPFADMHDLGDMMVRTGFADPVMDQERLTLTWSSPQALLDELRAIGGNVCVGRAPGLRTPRWRSRLLAALGELADAQGRIAMSLEIVYGHAYKAAPRQPRGELATVSLESLRSGRRGDRGERVDAGHGGTALRAGPRARSGRPGRLRFGLLAGMAAAAVALAGCDARRPGAAAPAAFHGIDVTGADWGKRLALADADGRARSIDEFRGKVVVVFFGYTQCPDVCPTTMAELAEVRRTLGPDGERVQGVFVTLDPERDTPEVLKAYVGNFGPGIVGLRGTLEQTREAAREFKVFFSKVPGRTETSYTIDHTAGSYVFDAQGRLRLFTRHGGGAKALADDLRILLAAPGG